MEWTVMERRLWCPISAPHHSLAQRLWMRATWVIASTSPPNAWLPNQGCRVLAVGLMCWCAVLCNPASAVEATHNRHAQHNWDCCLLDCCLLCCLPSGIVACFYSVVLQLCLVQCYGQLPGSNLVMYGKRRIRPSCTCLFAQVLPSDSFLCYQQKRRGCLTDKGWLKAWTGRPQALDRPILFVERTLRRRHWSWCVPKCLILFYK